MTERVRQSVRDRSRTARGTRRASGRLRGACGSRPDDLRASCRVPVRLGRGDTRPAVGMPLLLYAPSVRGKSRQHAYARPVPPDRPSTTRFGRSVSPTLEAVSAEHVDGDRFVPGVGPLSADLLLVGDAPGGQAVERDEPFVGRAGPSSRRFSRRRRCPNAARSSPASRTRSRHSRYRDDERDAGPSTERVTISRSEANRTSRIKRRSRDGSDG